MGSARCAGGRKRGMMPQSPGVKRNLCDHEKIPPNWRATRGGAHMKGIHIATITMCVASAVAATGLGVSSSWAQSTAPRYEVDATFPKPFPDRWVTGGFGGHCIHAQDHVL